MMLVEGVRVVTPLTDSKYITFDTEISIIAAWTTSWCCATRVMLIRRLVSRYRSTPTTKVKPVKHVAALGRLKGLLKECRRHTSKEAVQDLINEAQRLLVSL